MRRRQFITLLGGAAAAWPVAAWGQQSDGLLRNGTPMGDGPIATGKARIRFAAFREGLQKLGWVEGRNVRIDDTLGAPDAELRQRFAKELVALQPDLILSPQHAHHVGAWLQHNAHHPHHFRGRRRSSRQRLRRELCAAGRQRHRLYHMWNPRWPASGWSCSRRSRRASPGSPFLFSPRQRRPMPNTI